MIDSKQPYILLVLMAAGGILSDPMEHDEGASPQELMKNSSHRGAKPLSLASEQVAYIFQEGRELPDPNRDGKQLPGGRGPSMDGSPAIIRLSQRRNGFLGEL